MKSIVIIPTYNERENLAQLIPAILAVDPHLDILIVDDNSPDGTGELATILARQSHRINVLHRTGKLGLASAYIAGFRYALARGYDYVIEMDADLSHNPADLPRLLATVRSGQADVALGSRWTPGGDIRNWPLLRQILSRGGSWYARTILGLPIRDLTSGFKCFYRRVLETLDLTAVQTFGYGFQIELTYRALQAGFRVKEVPIVFTERRRGQSKMSSQIILEAALTVWRLRLTPVALRPVRNEVTV